MPTLHKRLNITLRPDLEKALSKIAKRDNMPEATKAADLIRMALEIEEDTAFTSLAKERDTADKNSYIKNKTDIWK